MRYFKIFLLEFQEALENRSRSFVWFLISFINPLILLIYWLGYYGSQPLVNVEIYSSVTTYYFLLIIANALLISHVEEDIAYKDIELGELINYLLKPFPYILAKFFGEIPWRIIQGFFGIVVFLISYLLFRRFINLDFRLETLFISLLIAFFGYIISFIFKVVVGLSAFWLVEYSGFNQLIEVCVLIFAGNIMPIDLYPAFLKKIAYFLPFSYVTYFPVLAIQGKLTIDDLGNILLTQFIWIAVLIIFYKIIWRQGLKKFSGVGN